MAEIIFAKPVHQYDSYTDFWRLVELSGFPIIRVDEIDITEDQIIITAPMNGDYREHFVGDLKHYEKTGEITGGQLMAQKRSGLPRLAHLIVWNVERPSGNGSVGNYAKESMEWITKHRYTDEVWVSDPTLADETMLRYVTLGSDYGLGKVGEDKHYDFSHMSVEISRRVNIYKEFKEYKIGPNCWPWDKNPNRDQVLEQSRFALNVHQDNWGYCEPLRMALFAAYGLPIISETLTNGHPYSDIYQAPYHNLAGNLKSILTDDYEKWRDMGLKLRKRLCEDFQFGKVVRKAIEESVGIGWR